MRPWCNKALAFKAADAIAAGADPSLIVDTALEASRLATLALIDVEIQGYEALFEDTKKERGASAAFDRAVYRTSIETLKQLREKFLATPQKERRDATDPRNAR